MNVLAWAGLQLPAIGKHYRRNKLGALTRDILSNLAQMGCAGLGIMRRFRASNESGGALTNVAKRFAVAKK